MILASWWYKKGPGKDEPWCIYEGTTVVDYNDAYIVQAKKDLGDISANKSDEEIFKLLGDSEVRELERRKISSDPWADLHYVDDKLVVKNYNQAFVKKLRSTMGDLIGESTTDDQIVQLYVERENLDREEPKLEVQHLGIEADGKLKIKLDWNKAFIKHLREHGITGETEDEAIEEYLSRLTKNVMDEIDDEQPQEGELITRAEAAEAFKELEEETNRELEEAARAVRAVKRRTKKKQL